MASRLSRQRLSGTNAKVASTDNEQTRSPLITNTALPKRTLSKSRTSAVGPEPELNSKLSATASIIEFYGLLQPHPKKPRSYTYFSLYRYSTCCEKILLFFGVIAAILAGFCYPMMVLEFGNLALKMTVIAMYDIWKATDGLHDVQQNDKELAELACFIRKDVRYKVGSKYFNTSLPRRLAPYCSEEFFKGTILKHSNDTSTVIVETLKNFSYSSMVWSASLALLATIYFSFFYIFAERVSQRVNGAYFEAFLRKDMQWLDLRPEKDVGSTIIENTEKIREAIGERLGTAIHFVSLFAAGLGMALYHGWQLCLVALISIPLLIICTSFVASAEAKQVIAEEKAYGRVARFTEEVLLNISSVFVYGGQKKEFKEFVDRVDKKNREVLKATVLSSVANGVIWMLVYINYAMTFYFGTKFALNNHDSKTCLFSDSYSPKSLVIVFFAMMMGTLNVGMAYPIIQAVYVTNTTAKDVLHTINTTAEVDNLSQEGAVLPYEHIKGKIDVEDVYFSYPSKKDIPVLSGLTFSVNPGMIVALVGASGSGKSTFLQLMTKLYLCDSGFIKLDGMQLRYHNTQWLRRHVAALTQDTSLFDCTVEENIRMGKQDATLEEIQDICKTVNAHQFIEQLPDGYNTVVGLDGCKLSTGQRQRIIIARTLIRNSKILLLDEWAIGLDASSEQIIQEYLKQTASKRTTFIVADKLSTAVNADLILVLQNGKVTESGTHADLMKSKGQYYNLASKPSKTSVRSTISQKGKEKHRPKPKAVSSLQQFGPAKTNLSRIYRIKKRVTIADPLASDDRIYPIKGQKTSISMESVVKSEKLTQIQELWQKYLQKESPNNISEENTYGFFSKLKLVSQGGVMNIIIGMLTTILAGMVLPVYGILFGTGINSMACFDVSEGREQTAQYAAFFVCIGIGAGIAVFLQHLTLTLGGAKAVSVVRKRLFFSIMRQDMGWFNRPENDVPALNILLGGEAGLVQYIIVTFYGVILECFSSIIIAICYSYTFGAKTLTFYAIGLVPIVVGASFLDNFLAKRQEIGADEAYEQISKLVYEVVQNKQVITTCQLERYFLQKYKNIINHPPNVGLALLRGFTYGCAQSAVFWCYCFCMLMAIKEITENGENYSNVLITGDNMIFGMLNIGVSLSILPVFKKALGAANHILNIINRKPLIDFDNGGEIVSEVAGDIAFQNVDFTYPHAPQIPILKGINWSIKQGQMIALIGRSGSGKSTCAQLVLKFYNPTSGTVLVDGMDITTLNCATLLSHVAVVEPDPRLFDRTVAENIAYGINHREVKIEEIVHAAKAANIHTFITSLPEGYESSATYLSGGQIQRIALARALLRNPSILMLDEVTSSLDQDSEKVVLKSIEAARKGRCCISISHRLYTIIQADLIVVLDEGSVVEMGTHSELVKKGGLYASLWETQNMAS